LRVIVIVLNKEERTMTIRDILLLGNPKLYEISQPVAEDERQRLHDVVTDLHDTMMDFRKRYKAGRAIAAPQIGIMKRVIYMQVDSPVTFINPEIVDGSDERIYVWDDCMCFPELLVRVKRHKRCSITYRDLDWKKHKMVLKDDLSELLQHEYDHLDGILAVSRAVDARSFSLRSQRRLVDT
jgi:peptide deformylase